MNRALRHAWLHRHLGSRRMRRTDARSCRLRRRAEPRRQTASSPRRNQPFADRVSAPVCRARARVAAVPVSWRPVPAVPASGPPCCCGAFCAIAAAPIAMKPMTVAILNPWCFHTSRLLFQREPETHSAGSQNHTPACHDEHACTGEVKSVTGGLRATQVSSPYASSKTDVTQEYGPLFMVLSMLAISSAAACRSAPPAPAAPQVSADTWARGRWPGDQTRRRRQGLSADRQRGARRCRRKKSSPPS